MLSNWPYVLKKLNENRDSTQEKFAKVNTPESLYSFWANFKKKVNKMEARTALFLDLRDRVRFTTGKVKLIRRVEDISGEKFTAVIETYGLNNEQQEALHWLKNRQPELFK